MVSLLLSLITLVNPTAPYTKEIVFLVDVSGSIDDLKIERSLKSFVEANAFQSDDYSIKVYAFDITVSEYPGGWIEMPGPEDMKKITTWLRSKRRYESTNILDSMRTVAKKEAKKKYTLVVLSDGLYTDSTVSIEIFIKELKHVVGFIGVNTVRCSVLEQLAKAGRGGYRMLQ